MSAAFIPDAKSSSVAADAVSVPAPNSKQAGTKKQPAPGSAVAAPKAAPTTVAVEQHVLEDDSGESSGEEQVVEEGY
jgi:cell division septation protein DedD